MSNQTDTLAGRVALVTGGSRGIGRAACLALAAKGAAVAVHYRGHDEGAEEVAGQIIQSGGHAIVLQGDMADAAVPAMLISETAAQLGPVDILVNNAGEMTDAAVVDMSDEVWE